MRHNGEIYRLPQSVELSDCSKKEKSDSTVGKLDWIMDQTIYGKLHR